MSRGPAPLGRTCANSWFRGQLANPVPAQAQFLAHSTYNLEISNVATGIEQFKFNSPV